MVIESSSKSCAGLSGPECLCAGSASVSLPNTLMFSPPLQQPLLPAMKGVLIFEPTAGLQNSDTRKGGEKTYCAAESRSHHGSPQKTGWFDPRLPGHSGSSYGSMVNESEGSKPALAPDRLLLMDLSGLPKPLGRVTWMT